MGDLSEQDIELKSLAALDNNEDVQTPLSPDTTPTFAAPATEPKKKSSILSIFSRQKKDKVDKGKGPTAPEPSGESSETVEALAKIDKGKGPAAPETVKEGSTAVEALPKIDKGKGRAIELEDDVPPLELKGDAPPQNASPSSVDSNSFDFGFAGPSSVAPPRRDVPPQSASQPSPVVLRDFTFAGPSSAAPPPPDGVAPDGDSHSDLPTLMITAPSPKPFSYRDGALPYVEGEVNQSLLATPRFDKERQEAESSRAAGELTTSRVCCRTNWVHRRVLEAKGPKVSAPSSQGEYLHAAWCRSLIVSSLS